ncbi:hypothetical protein HID58_094461 [Brassica napus]|uniref:AP2/ERF domain-containing protein n=1 Tax=Brassica napus TaxID=3708 RepID=A0ABQ7X9K2_BRANA|nr:hypothetical protein HID58_094461 [Brassica napus]
MADPQQRFRGVRQRHWGLGETRERNSRLGTFETAEDAGRAYDEAARLMCGPRARTNFPYNPTPFLLPLPSSSPPLFTAKLHKCYMASLQLTKQTQTQSQRKLRTRDFGRFPYRTTDSVMNMTANGINYNREGKEDEKEIKWEDGNANLQQNFRPLEKITLSK